MFRHERCFCQPVMQLDPKQLLEVNEFFNTSEPASWKALPAALRDPAVTLGTFRQMLKSFCSDWQMYVGHSIHVTVCAFVTFVNGRLKCLLLLVLLLSKTNISHSACNLGSIFHQILILAHQIKISLSLHTTTSTNFHWICPYLDTKLPVPSQPSTFDTWLL